jgi:hypothetical protein
MDQVITPRASDPSELPALADHLHDRYFDIEELTVDRETKQLRLPLYDRRPNVGWLGQLVGRQPPSPAAELQVDRVVAYAVHDRAGVRWFDIDGLYADASTDKLILRSNLPLELVITVDGVEVSIAPEKDRA